jgi:hypothetical protein
VILSAYTALPRAAYLSNDTNETISHARAGERCKR